ncbi:hypothetical protein FQ082_01960 [Psychrobacter sp. ANT_H56B]|uniref:hypothetical protein n=1 Tax=Psychrobacter sp. ANT_H56B TaxID=2597353 RepID=UPI0011F1BDBE|nr:hypothetical protein [Psychrobacter sp. ANT_H56B]KAA0929510.1 hypothetical protein FQ082_01960 [Psychrobacter sp. ANT_H56B]
MGNSKNTTSIKTSKSNATSKPIASIANQITFDIGDVVLCPSVGNELYRLFNDEENGCLCFTANSKTYHYRSDGKVSRDDNTPSLFHNTLANRQAIETLYHGAPLQKTTAKTNDIAMPVETLKSIASEMDGASQALHDVGLLLNMIYREKINPRQAISLARLSHDSTNVWAELLYDTLGSVNNTISSVSTANVGV